MGETEAKINGSLRISGSHVESTKYIPSGGLKLTKLQSKPSACAGLACAKMDLSSKLLKLWVIKTWGDQESPTINTFAAS